MKDLISSVFFHEIKNSLSSIKFGIEMFDKYDISQEEKKEFTKNLLQTIENTKNILDEYIDFVKFQFVKKLNYENVSLQELLEEIKNELLPFASTKDIHIYIQKTDIEILTNKFWLKRAIYNIFYNAIKYNRKGGSVNIKVEPSILGVYLSIRDTGIGIERKKLKSIFNVFERIDETQKGVGIGLALSKSIVENFGGEIHVKSNENIGSDFVLYLPAKPKSVTYKKIAIGLVPASILLFLSISYFPIYSQDYKISKNGGYITYLLEDGSILKFNENAKYELSLKKNLYNTTYEIDTKLASGSMSLKAYREKAHIQVEDTSFTNLGTDFEVAKDNNIKVAVFDGKVKGYKNTLIKEKEGLVVTENGAKKVKLLPPVRNLTMDSDLLTFSPNPRAVKYQILISRTKDFSNIENSFYTTNNKVRLKFNSDTLYYIKVFAYDVNSLPSMPAMVRYVSLGHYELAKQLLKEQNINEAILELQNSISTIKIFSPLPYYELAKLYFNKKEYLKSLKLLKKATMIDNKNLEYAYLLIENYLKIKDTRSAEQKVEQLLKIYPSDSTLLYYKALFLFKKGKYEQTQKILFKLLQLDPKNKKANLLMGDVMEKLNKLDLAKYYKSMGQ